MSRPQKNGKRDGIGRGDRENREMSRDEPDRLIEHVRKTAYRLHDRTA